MRISGLSGPNHLLRRKSRTFFWSFRPHVTAVPAMDAGRELVSGATQSIMAFNIYIQFMTPYTEGRM
jgi:hypothetical protein